LKVIYKPKKPYILQKYHKNENKHKFSVNMQKQQDGLRDVEWKCVKKIKLLNIHPSDYIQVNYEMISELNLDIGQG